MIVDLSHTIRAGMITNPGLPAPAITPHLTRDASRSVYAPGTEFAIDVITMIGNTGTYLDSPFHRYGDGGDLAALTLETLVDLPALVIHTLNRDRRGVEVEDLPQPIDAGSAVLICTGWDQHFGTTTYAENAPYLTEAAAQHLIAHRIALVGIDSVNIDDISPDAAGARPAHTLLLAHGIHIVEHLTGLDALPARGSRFTAAPPKIESFGTFPIRAFATIPDLKRPLE